MLLPQLHTRVFIVIGFMCEHRAYKPAAPSRTGEPEGKLESDQFSSNKLGSDLLSDLTAPV